MSSGILTDFAQSAQGSAQTESFRNDVHQDIYLMFNVVDENLSWYLEDNIQSCSDCVDVDLEDPDFQESNLMHGKKKHRRNFGLALIGPSYISKIP